MQFYNNESGGSGYVATELAVLRIPMYIHTLYKPSKCLYKLGNCLYLLILQATHI